MSVPALACEAFRFRGKGLYLGAAAPVEELATLLILVIIIAGYHRIADTGIGAQVTALVGGGLVTVVFFAGRARHRYNKA